ncbi:hypothetical protein AN641_03350 [Candidatus Epulonipiscioides gigas]|nr:hypothetical protein AN641_03350 [Epulopiscium sp. SCG-C07WGA-EpuloA2]
MMVIIFLTTNICLFGIYLLFVMMLISYFEYLHRSVLIYNNLKIYKTESQIKFVKQLVEDYSTIKSHQTADIDTYIDRRLNRDYIGKFKFIIVEEGITKIEKLSYAITCTNTVLYFIPRAGIGRISVILNIAICLAIHIIGIMMDLKKRKSEIILILKDYVLHQHPLETLNNTQNEINKQLKIEIEKLKEELDIKTLMVMKQNETIEKLEDRISLDEEYIRESHNVNSDELGLTLSDLSPEDVNKFLEEFGI